MRRLNLTRMALSRRESAAFPGDPCPRAGCGGELVVYCTKRKAFGTVRYIECNQCGAKPEANKLVDPFTDGSDFIL